MAVDFFLKIDGVDGESVESKHKGWLDIESWTWGESNAGTAHTGGGAAAGKVVMQDIHFVTRTSKASPKLLLACASGQHYKEAKLVGVQSGRVQDEFLAFTFNDVLVSSYQTGGARGGDIVTDQVSLNFAKLKVEYRAQKADGTFEAPVIAGWDLTANKKI